MWFILGGCISGIGFIIVGVFWCVTLVGIPIGLQCFKMATLCFFPFGKEVEYDESGVSIIINIIWLLLGGLELAAGAAVFGCILCITVIGIPFGLQHFKIAKLALMPFGARIK